MMATKRSRYKVRGTVQPDRQKFGMRIFHMREQRGLTQAELAARMGLCKQTVGHWESGRYMPSLVAAKRLADAFGMSLDELTRGVV
jgi:transcriptional regulator with XRE-family HTH domain